MKSLKCLDYSNSIVEIFICELFLKPWRLSKNDFKIAAKVAGGTPATAERCGWCPTNRKMGNEFSFLDS